MKLKILPNLEVLYLYGVFQQSNMMNAKFTKAI